MAKLTKTDKTTLTGKQLKMAEMLANPEFRGTNKELYEAIGISHDTFYRWIKNDAILAYTEQLIDKYTDGELGAVWKALIHKCRAGDIQAIKLYFELKGKYGSGKQPDADARAADAGVVVLPTVPTAELTAETGGEA